MPNKRTAIGRAKLALETDKERETRLEAVWVYLTQATSSETNEQRESKMPLLKPLRL